MKTMSIRVFAVLALGALLLSGCSPWSSAQGSSEGGSRLPVMQGFPVDSSKVDTAVTQPLTPMDPDTVLPPPR